MIRANVKAALRWLRIKAPIPRAPTVQCCGAVLSVFRLYTLNLHFRARPVISLPRQGWYAWFVGPETVRDTVDEPV